MIALSRARYHFPSHSLLQKDEWITNHLTKRWSEPPPVARSHFKMTDRVSVQAMLALGGGRSAFSR
jgi:hypothetical protein